MLRLPPAADPLTPGRKPVLLFTSPTDRAQWWTDEIGKLMPDLDIRLWPDVGAAEEITYALVWKPQPGALAQLPNLKACFSLGAGVDGVLADATYPRKVPLARVVDPSLTRGMSEYAILHTLIHVRRQRALDALQREKKWRQLMARQAPETRVGVLGLGEIGGDAARKLRALDFDVAGWSRTPKALDGVEAFHGADGFLPFLARSDVVICLLPLTAETRGVLDARAFAAMPKGAFVINAGRGGHVVEPDLLAALDSGHLSGAALDVFAVEPLPQDHPFWTHPKVTVTPHNASITDARFVARLVVENIARVERGAPPLNLVDFARGY